MSAIDVAFLLFAHNALELGADPERVPEMWALDPGVRDFWERQVRLVASWLDTESVGGEVPC